MKFNIKVSISLIVVLFAILTLSNKSKAAEYIWPIVGNNSSETYIDYEFYGSSYGAPIKNGKSGRNYVVDNNKWPEEQYYYAANESHYGTDFAGIYKGVYNIASICDGTVIATSIDRAYNPSINYQDRNQRRTWQGLSDGGGYGNYIFVQEESTGRCFLYAHLKAGTINVKKGQSVKKGQIMAVMGSSGDSGHTHLHLEIRKSKSYCFSEDKYGRHSLVRTNSASNLDPMNYIEKNNKANIIDEKKIKINELETEVYVQYLYENVLKRTSSKDEIKYWVNVYKNSESIAEITKGIFLSQEAITKLGYINNMDFVKKTYDIILCRANKYSEQELMGHVNKLNNGLWTRYDYLIMLCNSDEFVKSKLNEIIKKHGRNNIKYIVLNSNTTTFGDFDGDGKISIIDSTYCVKLASEIKNNNNINEFKHLFVYLDINNDGEITVDDATILLRYNLLKDLSDNTNYMSLKEFATKIK